MNKKRKLTVKKMEHRGCKFIDPLLLRDSTLRASEVIAYSIFQSSAGVHHHAFICVEDHNLIGVVNGLRTSVRTAAEIIFSAKAKIHVPDDSRIKAFMLAEDL